MIAVILFQKTDTGMGMGSNSASLTTARGTGNLLTRLTGGLAIVFMLMSLLLAYLAKREVAATKVIFDSVSSVENNIPGDNSKSKKNVSQSG